MEREADCRLQISDQHTLGGGEGGGGGGRGGESAQPEGAGPGTGGSAQPLSVLAYEEPVPMCPCLSRFRLARFRTKASGQDHTPG